MPILASVSIPVYNPFPPSSWDTRPAERQRLEDYFERRLYSDAPLPVQLSDKSPRHAKIVDRDLKDHGYFYTLRIGDIEIHDVGIDEVLDYVSAQHLETYENQQFQEERELEAIVEAEAQRAENEEAQRRIEQAKDRANAEPRNSHAVANASDAGRVATGAHGRTRPTYKHLFNQPKEHRRRRRDPATGELMPLSDDDDELGAQPLVEARELPPRRRRKRDPDTGELLPLPPNDVSSGASGPSEVSGKVRKRRKRHPQTGQLMPLGWRYDPDAPQGSTATELNMMSPAMMQLSLSEEHLAKRVRLRGRSTSRSEEAAEDLGERSAAVGEEDDSSSADEGAATVGQILSPQGQLAVPMARQPDLIPSTEESSPEPNGMISMLRKNDIASLRKNKNHATTSEDNRTDLKDDELDEGEWFIEAVVGHKMSDPRTHRPEYGQEPVMLYHVKWEGFDNLTWEPIESFPDSSVVEEYEQQSRSLEVTDNGTKDAAPVSTEATASSDPSIEDTRRTSLMKKFQTSEAKFKDESNETDESDTDEDDEAWEVEAILSHHLSDPRTHRPEHGKNAVMLYKVKWKGYQKPSWEPLDSFSDRAMVDAYRRKVGLMTLHYGH